MIKAIAQVIFNINSFPTFKARQLLPIFVITILMIL